VPILRGFVAAMGFLTRFGPSGGGRVGDFAASVPWFPVVGLVLGAVLTAPVALGLFAGVQWIAAWFVVVADLAATRGLHADGLADVADAWGSMARGERFFEILKDSRAGCSAMRPAGPARSGAWGGAATLSGRGSEPCSCRAPDSGTASWFWA
jgi:adenosylcobinamide-GDP ribazoletransferase